MLVQSYNSKLFPNPRPEEWSERDMAAATAAGKAAAVYLVSLPNRWYFPCPKTFVLLNKATKQSVFLLPSLDLLIFTPFLRPTLLGQRGQAGQANTYFYVSFET